MPEDNNMTERVPSGQPDFEHSVEDTTSGIELETPLIGSAEPATEQAVRLQSLIPSTEGPSVLFASAGGRTQESPVPPVPEQQAPTGQRPKRNPFGFLRKPVGKLAVAGVIATGLGAAWVASQQDSDGSDDGRGAIVVPVETPTTKPIETPTKPATPEVKKEVKSTPYNIVNKKVYQDGKLELGIVDGLQTRTMGPKSIVTGISEGEEVLATASSGFEINPNMESADKNVIDMMNAGLLLAWSSQTNIPESQKNLVTNLNESREVQMQKWNDMQERAKNGEQFNVTLRAYENDEYSESDVELNIGDNYVFKVDELVKPPVQIKWQSNMGTGVRISPDNKTFRVEFYDQYAGALGLFSEKVFISSLVGQTMVYLQELVVSEGKQMRPDVNKPGTDYQANVLREQFLAFVKKYNVIPDANPGTYSKDWHDSAIHPLP